MKSEEEYYHIVDVYVMALEEHMGKLHQSDSLLVQNGFLGWQNFIFVKLPDLASIGWLTEEQFYDILETIIDHYYSGHVNNSTLNDIVDGKMNEIDENIYNLIYEKQNNKYYYLFYTFSKSNELTNLTNKIKK